MQKQVKKMGWLIGVYVLAIVFYSFYHYFIVRSQLIAGIDQKLLTAIHSTQAILGPDFHDNVVDEYSITPQQDFELATRLHQFASDIDVAYVYSLKKFGSEILFVVSGATDQELKSGDYEPAYMTKYPEMDNSIAQVFINQRSDAIEYEDRWGYFRSMFVPFKTQSGAVYVVGADVSIKEVETAVHLSVMKTFMALLFVGGLIIPLMVLLIKSYKREWNTKYQALFYDELTGLPNRNQLMKDLSESKDTHLALIDIKRFRDVSNTYGPALGDYVLKQFAYRLHGFSHPLLKNCRAYRVEGDVFAIVENQLLSAEDVIEGTKQLINHLVNHDYKINHTEKLRLAITLGGVNQSEDAFMLANMALHEAKDKLIESFVYDHRSEFLPEVYKQNAFLKKQIQLALDEDRLVPFFQPIMSAESLKVMKYECLARIVDDQGDVQIAPDVFLPVARQARQYSKITQRMVEKSILAAQNNDFVVSINLSISDIMNGETRRFILLAVRESKIAEKIQFEILETEAIQDERKVLKFIKTLQRLGAEVGIDDMGRSYSNFDRLSFLPVDFIKIDGSIITSIVNDKEAQSVTKNIVKIAHRQNIKVTAEYCFDEATTQMAIHLGVDYLQGFYLGEPGKHIV